MTQMTMNSDKFSSAEQNYNENLSDQNNNQNSTYMYSNSIFNQYILFCYSLHQSVLSQ